MVEKKPRADVKTAAQIREAQTLQRAFGDDAAKSYLNLHQVDPKIADRVIEHGPRRPQKPIG